jgi:TolB-like protein
MIQRLAAVALALALSAPAPRALAAPTARKKVAVMEIRPLGTEPHKAELLSEVALTEASGIEKLDIIGRSDIASMVGFEKQKQVLGCAEDSSCLAEIGGALGVDFILVGSLGRLGALYRVDLKLVDTRKARVLGRFGESVEGAEEKLVATVQSGVRQLLLPLTGEIPLPPPPVAKKPGAAPVPLPPAPKATAPSTAAAPAPAAAPGPTPVASTTAQADAGSSRATWGWSLTGAGAVLGGLGVVAGLQAKSAFDREKAAAARGDVSGYTSAKNDAKKNSLVADACFVGGAASAGVGVYLLLTGKPAPVAVVPTEGGAMALVSGRF